MSWGPSTCTTDSSLPQHPRHATNDINPAPSWVPPSHKPLDGLQPLPVVSTLPRRCPTPRYTPSPPLELLACQLLNVSCRWPHSPRAPLGTVSPGNSVQCTSSSLPTRGAHSSHLLHTTHTYGPTARRESSRLHRDSSHAPLVLAPAAFAILLQCPCHAAAQGTVHLACADLLAASIVLAPV